jgi:hypothetical protein
MKILVIIWWILHSLCFQFSYSLIYVWVEYGQVLITRVFLLKSPFHSPPIGAPSNLLLPIRVGYFSQLVALTLKRGWGYRVPWILNVTKSLLQLPSFVHCVKWTLLQLNTLFHEFSAVVMILDPAYEYLNQLMIPRAKKLLSFQPCYESCCICLPGDILLCSVSS